jgi:hypothetical protein
MKRQSCPGLISVDQASIRREIRETAFSCGVVREFREYRRHWWPRAVGRGIEGIVTISVLIRHPAEFATIRKRHGHLITARCNHAPEGRDSGDISDFVKEFRADRQRKYVLAVDILVQAAKVASNILQEQWRRFGLAGLATSLDEVGMSV